MLRQFQEEIARLKSQLAKNGPGKSLSGNRTEEVIEEDPEELAELRQKYENEKQSLLNNQTMHKQQKELLLRKAEEKLKDIKSKTVEQVKLEEKIEKIEAKLLIGGIPLTVRTIEQERELERKRQIISQSQQQANQLKATYYTKEEEVLLLNQKFSSQQEEVEVKTKKLKKLFNRLQLMKRELEEVANAQGNERVELQETQMDLTRDLKLCNLIIENFIPESTKQRIEENAVYDEETGEWSRRVLRNEDTSKLTCRRPVSAFGKGKRPQSAYSRMAAQVNGNPRYRQSNILQVEIDLPTRTTSDFIEGGTGINAPNLQMFNSYNGIPNVDDVLEVEATPDVFQSRPVSNRPRTQHQEPSRNYPTSRNRIKR